MPNNAPQFIGKDALTHVAETVGKQIIMGPAYNDPELLDRLGIQVISGVQFKKLTTCSSVRVAPHAVRWWVRL